MSISAPDFTPVQQVLQSAIEKSTPAAQLFVRCQNKPVFSVELGWLDPQSRRRRVRPDTRFDLASITKLFTATAFMRLVDSGWARLDQPIGTVLPELTGYRRIQPYEDPDQPGELVTVGAAEATLNASLVTFRHLLNHTSGLPAWRPLYQQPDADAARRMALTTFFSYQPGTRVVYSDINFILLGIAIERITGRPLHLALNRYVIGPLGLDHTSFLPLDDARPPRLNGQPNVAPTEHDTWRQRRMLAEVQDENAYRLGGVTGSDGLFSIARDVATFGQMFLDHGRLLEPGTVAEMTRLQAQDDGIRRGLGFSLWSPDPEYCGHPFSQGSFGHTGYTGTSLWIDPQRQLVVALLTNDIYYGREHRTIDALRRAVHQAVVAAVDAATQATPARYPLTANSTPLE